MTARLFKSPNTHSVGEGKRNGTFTLSDIAYELLTEAVAETGESKNHWIRDAIAMKAAAQRTAKALALKAAIAAQDRAAVCSLIAIFFIGWIEVHSWTTGEDAEFRRAKVVRTAKGARRETEVA